MVNELKQLTELVLNEENLFLNNSKEKVNIERYVGNGIIHNYKSNFELEVPDDANAYHLGKQIPVRMARFGVVIDLEIQPITYFKLYNN